MQRFRLYRYTLCILMAVVMFLYAPTVAFAATSYNCGRGNHRYTVTIEQNPTETENGLRRYTCDLCGNSYTSEIPATGHAWGEWIVETEATCQEEGLQYRLCQNYIDHREEQAIPLAEHNHQETITKKPTCTEAGVAVYTCAVCGDSYTGSVAAIGHTWGEWITDKEPTSREEGHRYRVCLNDKNHIDEEAIAIPQITVTAVDVAFAATGTSLVWIFSVLIGGDISILVWYKKLKKRQLGNTKG